MSPQMLTQTDIVAALSNICGPDYVFHSEADLTQFLDEPRKRFHQTCQAAVRPGSVAELQKIAAWANENHVALIPQSGNTGLVGGQVPLSGQEVIISLTRLNRVREVDAEAGHMILEAGVILQDAQQVAEDAGALFPLSIASQGSARIGGVLSSNAGGVQVLAYGNARDLCLGVEAVLADGQLYQGLSSLRKDNTGYDLKNLLIGSEGTLGIITAAVLKLYPNPEGYETALIAVQSPEQALELFNLVRERAGQNLTAFELVPRFGIDMQLAHGTLPRDPSAGHSDWYVLAEISRPKGGQEGLLESALEAGFEAELVGDATTIAQSESERVMMWRAREQISEVQSLEGASIKHDISVPVASVPEFLRLALAAVATINPDIRPCPFGHMGDGNLHFNLTQPVGADPKAFMQGAGEIHDAVYAIVGALNGSISAEHGIGQLKTAQLRKVKDPVALGMMRTIKKALDPNGTLNPGKILD